jgi:hypothetical protein
MSDLLAHNVFIERITGTLFNSLNQPLQKTWDSFLSQSNTVPLYFQLLQSKLVSFLMFVIFSHLF